jgi:hypothetical protein
MTKLELILRSDPQVNPDETFDLLCFTGNRGFQIANNGWLPVVGRGRVQESLSLHARGDNQDEVIAYLETVLRKWKNYVEWSADYSQLKSVWLRVQWENETNVREARLLSFDFQINASPFGEYWQSNNFTEATITFERLEWEQSGALPTTITIPAGQSILAGMIAMPTSIVAGDVNGRILSMSLGGNDFFTPNTLWFGWRRNRHGNPALFEPLWDCELGTSLDGSTTVQGNVTASRGSIFATDFSACIGCPGETLAQRIRVPLNTITSNYREQMGKYLVLYRAMNSDDTTVTRARLIYGTGTNFTTLSRVEITGMTNWVLFEMGVVSIPANRFPKYSDSADNAQLLDYFIGIDAERVSGSGVLQSDCLILIPIDEAFLKTTGAAAYIDTVSSWFAFQSDLGDVSAYVGTDDSIGNSLEVEQRTWGIPPEIIQNRLYLIMAGNETAINGYSGEIKIIYIPRWSLARGNE